MPLTKKQKENLANHNKKQREKREAKRNKECLFCGKVFFDNSNRLTQRTCSITCGRGYGVKIRKEKGSYNRSDQQNQKMVATITKLRQEGKCVISPEAKKRLSENLKERWKSGEMKEKSISSSIKKYGVTHPMKVDSVKENLKKSILEKYGTESAMQNEKIKEKTKITRIEKGLTYQFDGKSMKEWSKISGVSYTYFKQLVNRQGFEFARKVSINKTGIETKIEAILNDISKDINYLYDYSGFKIYRPDFLLPEYNLIIECDGLAWHSDRVNKDKKYHRNKKQFYFDKGYKSLFFRSDEIFNKPKIVKSIIKNAINFNGKKFHARSLNKKTLDRERSKLFFNENHLMGSGSGRTYALLDDDGNVISALQVKWKNKQNNILEISRFCSVANTTVNGAYSRLIKFAELEEKPKTVITFVDNRYNNSHYLHKINFVCKNTDLSFMWTDGIKTFHRMKFKNNSGYNHGLYKIWDCGQSLYIKQTI